MFAGNELHLDDQDNEPINTSIDEVINEPLDDITEEQVTLSRPLHQIIKETFQEEIDELSKEVQLFTFLNIKILKLVILVV